MVNATATMYPYTRSLQAAFPSVHCPTTASTTSSGIDTKQTIRSPTARVVATWGSWSKHWGYCFDQDFETTRPTAPRFIDTKQTMRSPTARFSMKILTLFLRNSAQLTMVMMTITLPSNVSSISTKTVESRKTSAGVQVVSGPST